MIMVDIILILTPGLYFRRKVLGMVLEVLLPGWQPRIGGPGMVFEILLWSISLSADLNTWLATSEEGAGYGAGGNVSWLATQEWGARHGVKLASLITSLVFGFLCIHLPTKLCNARSEHLAGSPGEEARHGAGYAHHIFDLFFPLQPLFSLPLIKYLTWQCWAGP